jgi:hypothetical protein
MVMMTTTRPTVTGAGQAAILERDGVLVIAAAGFAPTGRPGALPVTYFDEVPQMSAGVVGSGLVAVVAVANGDGLQVNRQVR